ncbi:MAG: SRPBCC family protein [Candidatus Dormibacteraeota bacterium]|nr:SRPBCC family protein [Candidatus Dormibacteraeota bacterium]
MRGEHAVSVNRPAEVVFEYIADGTNNPTWRTSVVEVSLHSGTRGEGTVWRQVVRGPAGKEADADYRVTRCEPPSAYGVEIIAGPVRGTALYTLAPGDDGETLVTLTVVLKPRGAMRILTGFMLRQLVEDLDSLDRLRDLLNSRGGNGSQGSL